MSLNEHQHDLINDGNFREIEGLSSAKTLEEKIVIYEDEKLKSFNAFVKRYRCPFGGEYATFSPPEKESYSSEIQ